MTFGETCVTCRLNPYKMDMYDGINLSPLEVVFVKLKDYMLQADWTTPKTSQTYDMWRSHEVRVAKVGLRLQCRTL